MKGELRENGILFAIKNGKPERQICPHGRCFNTCAINCAQVEWKETNKTKTYITCNKVEYEIE